MKSNRLASHAIILIAMLVLSLPGAYYAFAASDYEYLVSAYDVAVDINSDGSADIRERIDFTFNEGFNNVMIPIPKNEGEKIEVSRVYMQRKNELIECKQLLAGQWDAEVFTGTYSVIDEPDFVKLKIYGSFYRTSGTVFIYYRVQNAIRRYQDVAEYQRIHVPELWENPVSNISIAIRLPETTRPDDVRFWLHGVIIGAKSFTGSQTVRYDVPGTVPGEYVETRIIFPQSQVPDCPMAEDSPAFERIIDEEIEYLASDKSDLLEARETAARKAGQRASYERMKQRTRNFLSILSLLLILGGVSYIVFTYRKVKPGKKRPLPSGFCGMDRLDPAEARMLAAGGKTGARAMLGKLMELASRGVISLGIRKGLDGKLRFTFKTAKGINADEPDEAERYFIDWISELSSNHEFDPIQLQGFMDSDDKAVKLKTMYGGWVRKVKAGFLARNILDGGIARYRNFGLAYSVLLLFLGFIVPVATTVAMGYALIPAGLLMLTYSLNIRKYTGYGAGQLRMWKALRMGLKKGSLSVEELPGWMQSCTAILGYGIALGIEKEAAGWIVSGSRSCPTDCPLCALAGEFEDFRLDRVVKNTLIMMDEAISSVQDT